MLGSRLKLAVEWLVFASLAALFCLHLVPQAWGSLNTDFPNYYLASRLVKEHRDVSRMYEWRWFEREKDHRAIDQLIIGLVPITPVSTLVVYPLTGMAPLQAKHVWLVFNCALLLVTAAMLCQVAGITLLESAIVCLLCFPIYRNLSFGQYYILLLALLVFACRAHQLRKTAWAGSLVGIAILLKIFPVLLLLYFARRREWRAMAASIATCVIGAVVSVMAFGWQVNRTYLTQIISPSTRGEALNPYQLTSSSFSNLLHRMLIYEPQLNLHPLYNAPWLFALLHPLLQLAVLLPAVLLVVSGTGSEEVIALEWSAFVTVAVAISPLPASYHFSVLVLPMAVLLGRLLRERLHLLLGFCVLLYLAIGFPGWNTKSADGIRMLLHVPRLWSVLLFTSAIYVVLYASLDAFAIASEAARHRRLWASGFIAVVLASGCAAAYSSRGMESDYAYRVPMPEAVLLAAQPRESEHGAARYIGLTPLGYRLIESGAGVASPALPGKGPGKGPGEGSGDTEELSFATDASARLTVRELLPRGSKLVSSDAGLWPAVDDASSPMLSPGGETLFFTREYQGRDRLYKREYERGQIKETAASPGSWNVLEGAASPSGKLYLAAEDAGGAPAIYRVSADGEGNAVAFRGEARYPAVSPDGRWLAYSLLTGGRWNLKLRSFEADGEVGPERGIGNVPCNQVEPSWESDSHTLLYASDCGRALWFTAVCRRRVIP